MKKYLVKLNQPLLINDSDCGAPIFCPVYGFLAPYSESNEELNEYYKYTIDIYVGYLAAMHEWSAGREKNFNVDSNKHWIDQKGIIHKTWDPWVDEIRSRNRKKLGLDFTLYVIDLYGTQGVCSGCGRDRSLIICETAMDKLVEIAQRPPVRSTTPHAILLFNRPIWLPAEIIWERPGYCLIYGVVEETGIDDAVIYNANTYLGYLALCEDYSLSGSTPSGFTTQDAIIWSKEGRELLATEEAIVDEGRICKEKNNLKLIAAELLTPHYEATEGVVDGLIVSQDLYERLREVIEN